MATRPGMTWDVDDNFHIVIFDKGVEVMRLFIGEALESVGRELTEDHIREIERSPWITTWHSNKDKE